MLHKEADSVSAVTNQLTNRDIALVVWLTVFAIFLLVNRDMRQSLKPLWRTLFYSKIALFLLVLVAYVSLAISAGFKVGEWQPWMLKDTLYWFFGTALATFFSINQAGKDEHYFKGILSRSLRFAVVLDFIINLYVFNLVIELLLLPCMVLLGALAVVADSKQEYAQVKAVLQWLIALVGLAILAHAGSEVFGNPHSLATVSNLEDLLLPLVLTILLLPLVYLFALYAAYEELHTQLKIFSRDKTLVRFATWQIVKACRGRLSEVRRFSGTFMVNVRSAESRAEIVAVTNEFRAMGRSSKP
jgi:hypothetical protein